MLQAEDGIAASVSQDEECIAARAASRCSGEFDEFDDAVCIAKSVELTQLQPRPALSPG